MYTHEDVKGEDEYSTVVVSRDEMHISLMM